MADISKIQVENTTYNIKDLTARAVTNRLQNKKFIMIGDSYANRTNSWQDRISTYFGLNSSNCAMKRVSGVGFYNTISNVNFNTMLTDNIPFTPSEVTDIIVCGGYNDQTTDENLFNAINNFMTTCKSTYPNANVYVGFIAWCNANVANYDTVISNLLRAKEAYSRCAYWYEKAHYLNNVEYALHNLADIDDSNFHPTDNGQLNLAIHIARAYLTGSTNVSLKNVNISSGFTATNAAITANDVHLYGLIENSISRMLGQGRQSFTFDGTTAINTNGTITLGTLTKGFISGAYGNVVSTCKCIIKTHAGDYYDTTAVVRIDKEVLKLQLQVINKTNNNWVNEAFDYIHLYGVNVVCDSMNQF